VTTEEFSTANPDERLLEARLEVSSLIVQGHEENLLQYFYRITSPNRVLQIADYRPRTTPASEFAGNIGIEKRKERTRNLGLVVSGAWDYLINASGTGNMGSKDSSSVQYELVPPQESLAASGTIHRGYGVYFKLRRMRQSLLEGAKQFVLVLRAPRHWRGGYLHLHCQASGVQRRVVKPLDEEVCCGEAEFLLALYMEGDEESKGVAARFVDAAIRLRRTAARHRREIHRHNYPTILHEVGALIGAVEPRISDTWLSELLYASQEGRLQRITERLPDDVRHAAHGYLAARDTLRNLESGGRSGDGRVRS
jgi:hypothetical protein